MVRRRVSTLVLSVGMLITIIVIGELGYMFIEGYSVLDAFFMTIITVSTVGFGEVKPLSPMGELFTIFMIIFSFGVFAYSVTSVTRFMVDGGFRNFFVNKRNNRLVRKLSNHVIIIGYGRVGSEVEKVLKEKGEKYLVIEQSEDILNSFRMYNRTLYVEGDATDDDTLVEAGIHNAKSLIATLPHDADNLLIVFSARAINPNLQIISRASFEWSDVKLKKAGANNVIMPDMVGGRRMAKLVASPDVISFLDYMRSRQLSEVHLVELSCRDFTPAYMEKTIGDLKFKRIAGVSIVGMKNGTGQYVFNPAPESKLLENYKLFVMGTDEQLAKLKSAVCN
jgi:voltage-gated potassium channel